MAVLEISDLVAEWDPSTGERLPVLRADVVAALRAAGDERAARIVRRIPVLGEVLDPAAVDRLLIRAHTELQRLNEEVRMAQRFAELLAPILAAVRARGIRPRVVDIGCGLGFIVRSLASSGVLGRDVDLVGVDFNRALVAEASRLAEDERLPCAFVCGDAFALAEDATVYLSSGVLHHFPADALPDFFRAQDRAGTEAFIHYDLAATRLAPFGAWLFHRARMREPLGRHDGVASARRAHGDPVLLSAAAHAAGMETFLFEATKYTNPLCAAMRPVVGLRPQLTGDVLRALGRRARGLAPAR
ncbi:class I SAM-dependent methyltransferase [Amycolatopsis dendrobii]|uniref:Class I SAM-dependent methyltransferase n=1 Tax=Amycolatopsis dendrobii TaxID=2760662 RepID=A0A7W3ZET7_9PSEU|nr:class I SAM-dependent methyltransferase [Amycolatopsis dendrobii]MBB1158383.1 class I SAM-dependent methyltransferase [Amycolatopsis dendrobii]